MLLVLVSVPVVPITTFCKVEQFWNRYAMLVSPHDTMLHDSSKERFIVAVPPVLVPKFKVVSAEDATTISNQGELAVFAPVEVVCTPRLIEVSVPVDCGVIVMMAES